MTNLASTGFDVSVGFWVKTTDEGLGFLYIGSTSVEPSKIGDAYRTSYTCLSSIPYVSVEMSAVSLIQASDAIAKDAIARRERQPGRLPIRVRNLQMAGGFTIYTLDPTANAAGQIAGIDVIDLRA